MDIEPLEALSSILGIKSRTVETDIRELAWLWEETLREARFGDPHLAFAALRSIARSYLRGRGLKMGNMQGVLRHRQTESQLLLILVRYVSESTVFESLRQAGITSTEAFTSALKACRDGKHDISLGLLKEDGNDETARY